MITQDEYEELLPYERDFSRAVYSGYKLATSAIENLLIEKILRKYEPKEQINWNCPNCAYRCYKRVGWMFFAYKEWLEKNTTTSTESTSSTEQEGTTSVKEPVKRGRKRTKVTKVVDAV